MSLNSLLDPNTQKENWSSLYSSSINTTQLNADNLPASYTIENNTVQLGDFSILQGTAGSISNVNSIRENIGNHVRISGSVLFTDVTAPLVGPNSLFIVKLLVNDAIAYPPNNPENATGSCNSEVRNPATVNISSSCCGYVDNNSVDFSVVTSNITAPDATRTVLLQYSLIYEKA